MEGEVNKMLVDDKGTILLCAFGLPPRSHPDDALRAVRTALLLADLLGGDVTSADLLGGDVTSEKDGDLLGGDVTSEKDGIPLTSSVEAEGAAPPPPPPKSAELVRRIVAALSEKPPFDALDAAQRRRRGAALLPARPWRAVRQSQGRRERSDQSLRQGPADDLWRDGPHVRRAAHCHDRGGERHRVAL